MKLLDIAYWIVRHRKGNSFKGYSVDKIVQQLDECCRHLSMLVITENNEIVGIVCAKISKEEKIIYINDILTIKKGIVKQMLKYAKRNFPTFVLQGCRKGHLRQFQIEHLLNHI